MIDEGMWNRLLEQREELLAEVKRLRELKITEENELEELCNRAIFYEDEYKLTLRRNQKLGAEVKRLREGIREICDTGTDTADDWLFMAIKRLEELIA